MIHHLDEKGTMAIVLPHGVLFRGGAEEHIRKYLIETRNYLDAVIGLPANIFYGTSIPTCVLVFKKKREHAQDILFIDASQYFEKATNQNNLSESDVDKIITAYRNRNEEDKYSKPVQLQEIADNDYNLNIPRYIDRFEEEEIIDINNIVKEIKLIDSQMIDTDKKIASFCKELHIEAPF
jgi:type I restriction enzyme M protein